MSNDTNANPFEIGNDENERLALEECVKRHRFDRRVSVLVIPAGRCEQASRFARLGAHVTVGDQPSMQRDVEGRILAAGLSDDMSFLPCTLDGLLTAMAGEPYDIIFIRRGLCCMPYDQARAVVRQLLLKLKIGGKLYISILGLHSELGQDYEAGSQPIEQRYTKLAPELAKKYDIGGPVCLYTERNLFILLLEAGASVLRTLTTTYGNVKGVAVRV